MFHQCPQWVFLLVDSILNANQKKKKRISYNSLIKTNQEVREKEKKPSHPFRDVLLHRQAQKQSRATSDEGVCPSGPQQCVTVCLGWKK